MSTGKLSAQMVTVRKLEKSDAAAWWRIRLESLEAEPYAFSGSVAEHQAISVGSVEARFSNPPEGAINLGAFAGDELVGTAAFVRVPGEKQRHKGRISAIYVSAAQRGKGTARALLARLLEIAKSDPSLEQILVSVSTSQDAACALYGSFGFEIYGTEPAAMKIGTTYVDSHDMLLRIKPGESNV
jgi:ribosomal protein S18 acetylase RimI-like enzyme